MQAEKRTPGTSGLRAPIGLLAAAIAGAVAMLPAGAQAAVVIPHTVPPHVVTPHVETPPPAASQAPPPSSAPVASPPVAPPPSTSEPETGAPATSSAPATSLPPSTSQPRASSRPNRLPSSDDTTPGGTPPLLPDRNLVHTYAGDRDPVAALNSLDFGRQIYLYVVYAISSTLGTRGHPIIALSLKTLTPNEQAALVQVERNVHDARDAKDAAGKQKNSDDSKNQSDGSSQSADAAGQDSQAPADGGQAAADSGGSAAGDGPSGGGGSPPPDPDDGTLYQD